MLFILEIQQEFQLHNVYCSLHTYKIIYLIKLLWFIQIYSKTIKEHLMSKHMDAIIIYVGGF